MSDNDKKKAFDTETLSWIFTICKRQFSVMVLLVLLNAFYGASSVLFANFSKKIIDGATILHSNNTVIKYAIALLLLVIFQMVLNIVKNSLSEFCSARLEMLLKKYLLNSIISKDYMSVTAYHTGDLQNRMFNDAKVVADGFTTIVPQIAFYVAKLMSSLIYLIIIDKIFALVFTVGGIVVFITTRFFRKTLKLLHKKVQETEGKTRSFIQEVLTNLLVIKAFSVMPKIDAETDELQNNNFKARMKRRNFSICANSGLGMVFSIGTVFAVAFGGWSILNNGMTYGTVTAILNLVNQVQSPFASLSAIMPKYYSLLASAERLKEIDELPPEVHINNSSVNSAQAYDKLQAVCFDNVSFSYDRDLILDNTSLSIKKGDFVAIMGISGIGKSTLLKLLLGVFTPQQGRIMLRLSDGDIDIDCNTRCLFTYVPQGNMLISGTIRENLIFINEDVTEEELERAVSISCAKQFIDELPDGLDTVIGEKGLGLSEGQIQRLAIARSILAKAPILLLDEATSALDEATEKQFLTNLKSLDGVTCIIVSHKKAALEICNKHIQIIDGKIVRG